MSEKIKTAAACLILIILLPVVLTFFMQSGEVRIPDLFDQLQQKSERDSEPLEQLAGILAGQISMDYEPETLKAQAVLVRTQYERDKKTQPLTFHEMEQLWGAGHLKTNYERCLEAVRQTKGQVLTYENQLILPCYTKVSAGMTRSCEQTAEEKTPYLKSVSCDSDICSEDYLAVSFYTMDEFRQKLALQSDVSDEQLSDLHIKTGEDGYVMDVQIADEHLTGDEFRNRFALNSACFYIRKVDDQMRIVTKGVGHGYGMSQYGANEMAKKGSSYEEILTYFFTDAVLKNIE